MSLLTQISPTKHKRTGKTYNSDHIQMVMVFAQKSFQRQEDHGPLKSNQYFVQLETKRKETIKFANNKL